MRGSGGREGTMQRELWWREGISDAAGGYSEDPDPGHAHSCPNHGLWFHHDLRCPEPWDACCPEENVETLYPLGVR